MVIAQIFGLTKEIDMKWLQKVYHWGDNRLREITTWSGFGIILVALGAFFEWPLLLLLGCAGGALSVICKEE